VFRGLHKFEGRLGN